MRSNLERLLSQMGKAGGPIVADVWIDGEGMTRRLQMKLPLAVAGLNASTTVQMDLYDFGTKVDVQPPPASEVRDISDASQLQSLLPSGA